MADQNHTTLNALSLKTVESNQSTPFLNVDGETRLGASGVSFVGIRKSTASVAIGGTAADSVTTAVTVTGVAAGDPIIAICPASIWSGAYHDLSLSALATGTNTVTLAARNSTTTAVNTAAMNFDFYWIDLA